MQYLIIALSFAIAGGVVARIKGNSFVVWFLISGVVPMIGLAAAVLYRSDADEPRRRCPTCGRVCMLYDALCTRCGTELEYTTDTLG
ncbi:MAG TPA: hypothetical protein VFB41_00400 [Solirubrobacteraceae bacterium]|nr:hypothetical protein [Solirubrobacteraceae bacterium]